MSSTLEAHLETGQKWVVSHSTVFYTNRKTAFYEPWFLRKIMQAIASYSSICSLLTINGPKFESSKHIYALLFLYNVAISLYKKEMLVKWKKKDAENSRYRPTVGHNLHFAEAAFFNKTAFVYNPKHDIETKSMYNISTWDKDMNLIWTTLKDLKGTLPIKNSCQYRKQQYSMSTRQIYRKYINKLQMSLESSYRAISIKRTGKELETLQ